MQLHLLKSKIRRADVTGASLNYEGREKQHKRRPMETLPGCASVI